MNTNTFQIDIPHRLKIGIVAGAGPEAGIDLWRKILLANKQMLGERFHGDLQAPDVTVFSVPRLGLAMDIAQHEQVLWEVLEHAVRALAERVDLICIACNVLHHYSERIRDLNLKVELVSVVDVVAEYIKIARLKNIALLSIDTVVKLDQWSPYRKLTECVQIETPRSPLAVNRLVHDIKKFGPHALSVQEMYRSILEQLASEKVFLACTELPLVPIDVFGKQLIDVTQLLADGVVRKALSA